MLASIVTSILEKACKCRLPGICITTGVFIVGSRPFHQSGDLQVVPWATWRGYARGCCQGKVRNWLPHHEVGLFATSLGRSGETRRWVLHQAVGRPKSQRESLLLCLDHTAKEMSYILVPSDREFACQSTRSSSTRRREFLDARGGKSSTEVSVPAKIIL